MIYECMAFSVPRMIGSVYIEILYATIIYHSLNSKCIIQQNYLFSFSLYCPEYIANALLIILAQTLKYIQYVRRYVFLQQ